MDQVWYSSGLSEAIINNGIKFDETRNIATDIVSGHLEIQQLVGNMEGVLTNTDVEKREKGMIFFTKILKELPKSYLTEMQIKFISKFYIDRLKDNHRIIPTVIDGYLAIVEMKNYKVEWSGEFFTVLFKEVTCQSQVRHDRYNIYTILYQIMKRDIEYVKALGPDFVYGVISSIEGERDPRNLMFLFTILPTFIKNVPLGHLTEEMFEVLACYFPIDFNPAKEDPSAVTRDDLANMLYPCLCAIKDFGEPCLLLLMEKLESNFRLAKLDSLELLAASCKIFDACVYFPFLKRLWSIIHAETMQKTDEDMRMAAHKALSNLIVVQSSLTNTNQEFENFVKGIIISMQREIADATTVAHFTQATKVLLTASNAEKESCVIVTKIMIPSAIAYYEYRHTNKLQMAGLEFLAELYDMVKKWEVFDEVGDHIYEIPGLCLKAVSQTDKDYQIVGLETLLKVRDILKPDLVLPFVEILVSFVQQSRDDDVLKISIKTIHAIARKYPEMIMDYVVKGKFDVNHLTEDKATLQKRARLLSNLASIDDFTKVILQEMLKIIVTHDEDAAQVVEALSECILDKHLYPENKVVEIESDHGMLDKVINWLYTEKDVHNRDSEDGFILINRLVANLPADKQKQIIDKHTQKAVDKCAESSYYFLLIEAIYGSLRQGVCGDFLETIVPLSITLALDDNCEKLRNSAASLLAHLLNKADFGKPFEVIYEILKSQLDGRCGKDEIVTNRLLMLCGWITKALVMRGSDMYREWFYKITKFINDPERCKQVANAVKLIMSDLSHTLTERQHCRLSPIYKQRVFLEFYKFTQTMGELDASVKENYYLIWAYILGHTPRSAFIGDLDKISRIIINSVIYDNKYLLIIMIELLIHLVDVQHSSIVDSLQSLLPRLTALSQYKDSMDVRIISLRFVAHVADVYRTSVILPYRQDMLIGLAPALDDRKRLVRDVAVKARTRWFMVGAPGEIKKDE